MSRSKLFNMIKSRGEQPNGRNAFDLSNWHGYTQNFATIQPMKAVYTLPDDYMEVDVSDMCQNINPMNTAAPLSAQRELCAYFVPHNFIWHNYNQYQATREDPDSSALSVKGISYEPRFILYELYFLAFFYFSEWLNTSLIRRSRAYWRCLKDEMDMDKYSYLYSMDYLSNLFKRQIYTYHESQRPAGADYLFSSSEIYDMRIVTGNGTFVGSFYDLDEGTDLNEKVFFDVVGQWKWCDVLRKLDLLGYGNLYPLFKPVVDVTESLYEELISKLTENVSSWDDDRAGQEIDTYKQSLWVVCTQLVTKLKRMTVRLDSVSAYDTLFYNTQVSDFSVLKRVKVFALFAYNHVFYNMFRNTYRDLDYDVRNYNCDFLQTSNLVDSVAHVAQLPIRFLNLETHQWKKDMFTSLLPDMQLGAVSSLSLSNELGRLSFDVGSNVSVSDSTRYIPTSSPSNSSVSGTKIESSSNYLYDGVWKSSVSPSFDVLSLRRAEALQQYYMDLMRAGNRTEDIFKQIYGKTPKSEEHKTPYFVDAVTSPLSVNPILATAETEQGENGRLGDIAARCLVNSQPLRFKFSTSDFGVLLFLNFMSVDSAYNSYRIDPHLMNLTPESNFIPQLMNLGYEWLTRESLNNLKLGIQQDQPLGCSPRYIEFKTDVDMVHGNLCDAVDINLGAPSVTGLNLENYEGSLNIWAVTRTDMQQEDEVTLRNFYQDPRVVNNIFKVFKDDNDPSYESDQFICFSNIKIDSVRQLSELGLPRFV